MFLKKRIITVVIIIIPLLLIFFLMLTILKGPLIFFPNKNHYFIDAYGDNRAGGKSSVERVEATDSYLLFRYTLKKRIETPFAYLYIQPETGSGNIDLSGYDYCTIRISSRISKTVHIVLKAYLPGITDPLSPESFVPLEKEMIIINEPSTYTISLEEFMPSREWKETYGVKEGKVIRKERYKQISSLEIYSFSAPPGITDTIVIEELKFYKTKTMTYVFFALCFGLYIPGILIIFLMRKKSGH